MIDFSNSELRVAFFMEQMKKAMPEVKRQIEVYEKALKNGTLIKNPKPAPQFNNAPFSLKNEK